MAIDIDQTVPGGLIGHLFQYEVAGKHHYAQISHDALQDYFGAGRGLTSEAAFEANAYAIRAKAREVFLSNQVRSPLLLTTDDFK